MAGRIKHCRLIAKSRLGAVAVVDIKVDNGDALKLIMLARIRGGNRYIIKQAKTHCLLGFGMMSRWAYRAKGIVGFAVQDFVDRIANSAHRTKSGLPGAGRDYRVLIQIVFPLFGYGFNNGVDMKLGMNQPDLLFGAERWRLPD